MKLVLVGAVISTRVALERMIAAGLPPMLVITLPPDRSSINSDYVDLQPLAQRAGVPVLHEANVNSPACVERLASIAPDVICVIGWSRLCGDAFRATAKQGVIGYHPTLLPEFRGRSALAWTILLDLRETGGTLFWMDEGVDSGGIAVQQRLSLTGAEYLGDLMDAQMALLADMCDELVAGLLAGGVRSDPQDEQTASYLAQRVADDGRIDWSRPSEDICRLIRAVSRPYPGAWTKLDGRRAVIWRASPVSVDNWHAQQGQIFRYDIGRPVVRCGAGTNLVIEDMAWFDGGPMKPLSGQKRFDRPSA